MNQKVICIILARGGSKGLKKKNLRTVNGKPLIYYPISHAIRSKVVNDIIVSTDDVNIAKAAKKYGAIIPFIRPKRLAEDLTTTEDTLRHALTNYEKKTNQKFDIGVFLTATDIFRDIKWIKEGVKMLKLNPKLESVFSGHITHKNFWEKKNNKWVRLKSWMKKYSSRQIRRLLVREDTGLACISRTSLWRKGMRIGDNVDIILNDDVYTGFEIHTLKDLNLVRQAYKLRFKK
jgi:CMP-N-acetylneuraminic acid synthetase